MTVKELIEILQTCKPNAFIDIGIENQTTTKTMTAHHLTSYAGGEVIVITHKKEKAR